MPDSKITALTSISTSTDPANDPLVIVDVSDTSMAATGTTKKVTLNQLLGASGTATLASATITGDLTVDTNVLKVDTTNNRVGVGTATPAVDLEVGDGTGTRTLKISGATNIFDIGFGSLRGGSTYGDVRLWTDRFRIYNAAGTQIIKNISGTNGDETWYDGAGGTRMTLNSTGLGVGGVPSGLAPVILCEGIAGTYAKFSSKVGAKTWSAGYRSGTLQYEIQEDGVERYTIGNGGTPHTWYIGASTAMTLNSTGLGVGASPTTKLDVLGSGDGELRLRAGSDAALIFSETAANKNWKLKPSGGDFQFQYSATAYNSGYSPLMYLTATGNVGIGVTPSAWATLRGLQNGRANLVGYVSNSEGAWLTNNAFYDGSWKYQTSAQASHYQQLSGVHSWSIAGTGTAGNAITFTQAMTLDASGNLLVGTTGLNGSWNTKLTLSNDSGTTKWAVGPYLGGVTNFLISAGASAGVYLNGTAATSWTSASDERLKDIIEPISNAIAKVGSLRAVIGKFKFDENNTRKPFLIAQDIQAVLPEAVDASNPEKLGVAYTDVIPLLVAAIKELTAEVNALKNA